MTGSEDHQGSALPIVGDDAVAKRTVGEFLAAIGFAADDAGPLAEAWRFQRDTPGYVVVYKQEARVTADVLAAKLAAAKRYRDR